MNQCDYYKQINVGSGHGVLIKDLATKISAVGGFSREITWDSSKADGTL